MRAFTQRWRSRRAAPLPPGECAPWSIRRVAVIVTSLLVLPLTACGGARVAAPDARWVRAETTHFTLYTDLPSARAQQRVVQLERLLSAFLENGWNLHGELPMKLNIVMFGSRSDFRTYGGTNLGGYYLSELQYEPWILLPDPSQKGSLDTLRHELTHHIAHQGMHAQPRWFSEGIASYFETATFDADGSFTIGSVPRCRWESLRRWGPMRAKALFADDVDVRDERFYASAWLLVHYLMSVHSREFTEYQRRIALGQSDVDAWSAAFPTLPRAKLDVELAEYGRVGSYAKFSLAVTAHEVTARTTPLALADRHALQALLFMACKACNARAFERAKQHVDLALAADPSQPQAATLRASISTVTPADRIVAARSIAEAQPKAWLGWLYLGFALAAEGKLGSVDVNADPVARMRALAPRHPYGTMLSALQRAQRGDRDGALADAQRARRMAPTNPRLLVQSAEVLALLSACGDLQNVVHQIAALHHATLSERVHERLSSLVTDCMEP